MVTTATCAAAAEDLAVCRINIIELVEDMNSQYIRHYNNGLYCCCQRSCKGSKVWAGDVFIIAAKAFAPAGDFRSYWRTNGVEDMTGGHTRYLNKRPSLLLGASV